MKLSTKIYLFLQVQLLQSSNKRDSDLKVNNQPTSLQGNSIKFHYTDDDYDRIIRAYIDAVTSNFNFLCVSFNFNSQSLHKYIVYLLKFFINLITLEM